MILLLGVIWLPVLSNGFLTNWDDQWMVLNNPHLLQVDFISAIHAMFTEYYGGQYSPVNTLTYFMIVKWVGMEPFGFQLFFLVIHILNFLLVGSFLDKLLQLIKGIDLGESQTIIAWLTAFLFAIHPLQVESVAWISASKVILYSFFYLLGLCFYLMHRRSGRKRYMVFVILCFLASLLSKEQAVVFFFSLIAIDLVTHSDPKENIFALPKSIWIEKIPFFVFTLLFGWLTISISEQSGAGGEAYTFGQRILFANYSFWEYIIKITVPHNLSHLYFFPMDPGETIPIRFWFYPLASGIFIWLLIEYRRFINKLYLFGGLFFLINIILVLHIIPFPREAIVADRYVYLSIIGFFLVIIYSIAQWCSNHVGYGRNIAIILGGIYLLTLVGYTNERTKAWKNMETLNESVKPVIEKHMGEFEWPGT